MYPYVFQGFSLSSGLPLEFRAYFSAILLCPAIFILPCVMIPSYLIKNTNCVAPHYAILTQFLECSTVMTSFGARQVALSHVTTNKSETIVQAYTFCSEFGFYKYEIFNG